MPDIFDEIELDPSPVSGGQTGAPMMGGDIFDTIEPDEFMGFEGTRPIDEDTLSRLAEIKGPTEGPVGFERPSDIYAEMGVDYSPMPIGEMATKVRHTVQPVPALGYASLKKGMGGLAQAVGAKATGKQWAEEADLVRQQIAKEHPLEPGGVGETVRAAAANIYAQAPSLAIGLFNPALGLASFGLPSAGESFHELEKAGFGAAVKYPVAITKGVAEVATEMIPFGILFKKGMAPGKRMLQLYVTELFGENVNTTINAALDKVTLRPDMTMDDYIDDLKQTTKQTLAQVTMMGAGAAGIHRIVEGKKPPIGEPTPPIEAVSPEVAPDTMPEVAAQPTEAKRDIFDEISPTEAPSLEELAAEFEEAPKGPKLRTVVVDGKEYTEGMHGTWRSEEEGIKAVRNELDRHKALEEGFTPPKQEEVQPRSYKGEIKEQYPDLTDEDISYLANEMAQDLDRMGPIQREDAKAWKAFAETGKEVSTKGKTKGQILSALDFPKNAEAFKEKARSYVEWKDSPRFARGDEGPKLSRQVPEELTEQWTATYEQRKAGDVSHRDFIPPVPHHDKLKAAPAKLNSESREVFRSDKKQAHKYIEESYKERGDVAPVKKLYRAIYAKDKDWVPGHITQNPTHPHMSQTGVDLFASWWTTDPLDAIKIGRSKTDGDVEIIVMDANEMPEFAYVQNVSDRDSLDKVWFGFEDDIALNEKTSIYPLTKFSDLIGFKKEVLTDDTDIDTWGAALSRRDVAGKPDILGAEPQQEVSGRDEAKPGIPKDERGRPAEPSKRHELGDQKSSQLQAELDQTTKRWKNAPPTHVVQSTTDLPPYLQKYISSQEGTGEVEGLFDPRSKSVYLISDNITSPQRATEVLLHETIGHYGLRGTLGKDIKPILNEVYLRHQKEAKKIAKQYGLDTKTEEGRQEAAEEVLANLAMTQPKATIVQKAVAAVRKWAKKMGLKIELSDNDIRGAITGAAKYVEGGKVGVVEKGKALLSRAKDTTKTQAFKKWFGDSKVVDEKGEPLVVYHGTKADIEAFDRARIGEQFADYSIGFNFISDPNIADSYGTAIYPTYIKAENPLYVDSEYSITHAIDMDRYHIASKVMESRKTDKPYDAVIARNKKGDMQIVVFEPTKIKSVFNIGTFDPQDPRIAFSRSTRPEGKAGQVYDDLMEARETSLQKKKTTIKQTFKKLRTSLVDVAGNTKAALNKLGPEGKKAVMKHIAHGGANAKALRMSDKVTKEIYGKLTAAEHDHLDQYIYARRHLEIVANRPGFKLPGNRTPAHMQALIDSIPQESLSKIEKRAETYWKTMDEQLTELRKEGLLTEAQLKGLRAVGRYYSPRVVLDYVDPERTSFEGGKKITIPDSGIKKLSDEGSEKLVEGDSSLLLTQVINRTQSRIFKNRANQALWELAEAQPDNPMVRKVKTTKPTKDGKPIYQAAPRGWEKISVMIDGQQKQLMMPEEFAGEWIFKDPILLHSQRNAIQWMTGTKILKSMATGLNPEFAFTNVPRDLALIWMSTPEYSPAMPKAMAQMGIDISGVIKDAVMRKGAFDDYVNEGGGMEFLTHQGRFTPKIHGHLGKIQNVMGYLGETSEIMTRLALRKRAIKNGATPEEATIIARNYLDFTQGGNLAKAADSALPYLNAGIQATRGLVRAGVTNPKLLSVKVAQVGGLATMLYMANRLLNEDAWDEIPDRDKVNNWIITTPYSYHDKTGTKRYIYFKIAKDQGQRVFASIFEAAAAKSIGDDVDTDQVMLAVRDFIPFAPTNLPPAVEAILGYSANKDFWFNEDIWRGPKIKPEEEWTRYTPEAYKKMGKATGLSPDRLKNSLQQFFTYGNIWTSLVGGGTQALLKGLDEKDKDLVTEEVILKKPFIRKMVRSTDPYYKYGKDIEESGIDVRTEKYKITRDFDDYAQKYFDGKVSNEKVIDYVKKQPILERKRLIKRFGTHKRLKDIPDRRFWVELLQEPPETRAYIYWGRLKSADAKEKDMLEKTSKKILGFRGKTFFYHLNKLKKGAK